MSPVADNPVIVPERELEEEKKPAESEPPRIRCPLCGWSPGEENSFGLGKLLGNTVNTDPCDFFLSILKLTPCWLWICIKTRRGWQSRAGSGALERLATGQFVIEWM